MAAVEESIIRLEEVTAACWPAYETLVRDGWVLRFSGGCYKRSNAVLPLYATDDPAEQKIGWCEAAYAQRGLRTVFKLTPASCPPSLDEVLDARGYTHESLVSVQTMDLRALACSPDGGMEPKVDFREDWLGELSALTGMEPVRRPVYRKIVGALEFPAGFFLLRDRGDSVACGVAVLYESVAVLFSIAVAASRRRQGYGGRMVDHLLWWAREQGADTACLQVHTKNEPALALYGGKGFAEAYRYWYRIKDNP